MRTKATNRVGVPIVAASWRLRLLSVNEGGGPVNFTVMWSRYSRRPFFYVYVLGRKWYSGMKWEDIWRGERRS